MIVFACPNPACRKRHQATDDAAGEVVECDGPGCGYRLVVPTLHKPEPVMGEVVDLETGAVMKDWRTEPPSPRPTKVVKRAEPPPTPKRSRRRSGFRCPFCDTDEYPLVGERISVGGWVVFAVLLIVFFPLFWIGLLMKERYRICYHCGLRLER